MVKGKGSLKQSWDKTQSIGQHLIQRHKRWQPILEAKGAKASAYIAAEYGTNEPNGLNITPWLQDETVEIKSTFEDELFLELDDEEKFKFLWRTKAAVARGNSGAIFVNPLSGASADTIRQAITGTPETAHLRQLGKLDHWNMTGTIGHEFIHTRQNSIKKLGWVTHRDYYDMDYVLGKDDGGILQRTWRKATNKIKDTFSKYKPDPDVEDYFGRNVEIQSRIHELMATGYAEWGKLPTTKTELWAAMHNFGIEMPRSTLRELRSTPEGKQALQDFTVMQPIKDMKAEQIESFNSLNSHLTNKGAKESLWERKYPLLYGQILEYYGDVEGRARMDMGANPRPAIEVLQHIVDQNGESIPQGQLDVLVDSIPANLAVPFLNSVAQAYPADNPNYDNLNRVCRDLVQRDDVKHYLLDNTSPLHLDEGDVNDPPLSLAILHGHTELIKILLDVGCDPMESRDIMDIRGVHTSSGTPLANIKWAIKVKNDIDNPEEASEAAQKYMQDPAYLEHTKKEINAAIEGTKALLEHAPDAFCKKTIPISKHDTVTTSIAELAEQLGIDIEPYRPVPSSPTHAAAQQTNI